MSFVKPAFSKGQINRAGEILASATERSAADRIFADEVLANWRASHGYPINTFQATLRSKLKTIDRTAIVAQRLKRAPSIILKLQRFPGMKLARMQDIGGLRTIVGSVARVRRVEASYRASRFEHDLVSSKDYLKNPKDDGYRGIHLIYRYANSRANDYDGLSLELQIRTKLQHAWATAVETMGTFLGQALKSGQGEYEWRSFFSLAGAALANVEKTAPVPGFENCTTDELHEQLYESERKLRVLEKLSGFAIAADRITTERGQGGYHLIVLNSSDRTVSIRPYPVARLEDASRAYAEIENRTKSGEAIEAVLVSAGPIDSLRKAFPNYFLDTQVFVSQLNRLTADWARGKRG
jgi:putative GTP pyrophosphokinase